MTTTIIILLLLNIFLRVNYIQGGIGTLATGRFGWDRYTEITVRGFCRIGRSTITLKPVAGGGSKRFRNSIKQMRIITSGLVIVWARLYNIVSRIGTDFGSQVVGKQKPDQLT